MIVLPEPVIDPPVQLRVLPLANVTSPLPLIVPLMKVRLGKLSAAFKVTVAPLMVPRADGANVLLIVVVPAVKLTVPVGINAPAGKLCVPALIVTVPLPLRVELAP